MLFLMRVLGCLEGGLGVFRATVCLLHAPVPTVDEAWGRGRIAFAALSSPCIDGSGPRVFGLTCRPALSGGSGVTTLPAVCAVAGSGAGVFLSLVVLVIIRRTVFEQWPRFIL